METVEQDRTIAAVCPECGAERPSQAHDPLCPHAESDTIATAENDAENGVTGSQVEQLPDGQFAEPIGPVQTPGGVPQDAGWDAGWVVKIEPVHECIKPEIDNRTFVGSVWRCGGCGQNWMVFERRGRYQGTKAFKKITPEKAQAQVEKHQARTASEG